MSSACGSGWTPRFSTAARRRSRSACTARSRYSSRRRPARSRSRVAPWAPTRPASSSPHGAAPAAAEQHGAEEPGDRLRFGSGGPLVAAQFVLDVLVHDAPPAPYGHAEAVFGGGVVGRGGGEGFGTGGGFGAPRLVDGGVGGGDGAQDEGDESVDEGVEEFGTAQSRGSCASG